MRFLRSTLAITVATVSLVLIDIAKAGNPSLGTDQANWDFDSRASSTSPRSPNEIAARGAARMLVEMNNRWNAHDMDGYLSFFWNSPQLVFVDDGREFLGWEELNHSYKGGYHGAGDMGAVKLKNIQVRMLRPDLALAVTSWDIVLLSRGDTASGLDTSCLQKFGNDWKIIVCQSSISQVLPTNAGH